MKRINGMYLPDYDTFFSKRPDYEARDHAIAMKYVNQYRTAIDVGAHCGYWSRRLAVDFDHVIAFEPIKEHLACLIANTEQFKNITYMSMAASHMTGLVTMTQTLENGGMSHISENGTVVVPIISIDSIGFDDVDFIKIDVEGHEYNVLAGAEQTIRECKPVIMTEILDEQDRSVYTILSKLGYKVVDKVEKNVIWKTS